MRFRVSLYIQLALLLSLSSSLFGHGHDNPSSISRGLNQGLRFEENKGQYPDAVRYMAEVNGGRLWLENDGISYAFCDLTEINLEENHRKPFSERKDWPIHCDAFKVRFEGAATRPEIEERGKSSDYHNYFHGNDPAHWGTGAYLYDEVEYQELYPGINLRFYKVAGMLKYDFILSPGADASLIRMRYDGVKEMHIDAEGNLLVETALNKMLDQAPVAWNLAGDGR